MKWFVALGAFLIGLTILGLVGPHLRVNYSLRALYRSPRIVLHSEQPYHEIHVPFTFWNNCIVVQASVGGRPVKCLLDTGSSISVWPLSLTAARQSTGLRVANFAPYVGAYPREAEWVILPKLQLGAYEIQHCVMIGCDPGKTSGVPMPILGCFLLRNVVLTIDYRKQELIFRDRTYDLTHRAHSDRGNLLSLDLYPPSDPLEPSPPIVAGMLAGQPVRFLIDTGATTIGVALTNPSLIKALQKKDAGKLGQAHEASTRILPDLSWSCGSLFNSGPVDLLPRFYDRADAVIGERVLQYYRITLDYSRKKLLLEFDPIEDCRTRLKKWRQLVRLHPYDFQAHRAIADILRSQGHYAAACQEYRMALDSNPNSDAIHLGLGRALFGMRNYQAAGQEFRKTIQLSPYLSVAHIWLGRTLDAQGQRAEASAEFQKALDNANSVGVKSENH